MHSFINNSQAKPSQKDYEKDNSFSVQEQVYAIS
jgi:hypothetical protein